MGQWGGGIENGVKKYCMDKHVWLHRSPTGGTELHSSGYGLA